MRHDCTPPTFTIDAYADDPVAMYLEDVFLSSQVLAGMPAISVLCFPSDALQSRAKESGKSKGGLPIGLQLMGPQWSEETVLRTAHAYEAVSGVQAASSI
jgi:aspartyl-tRNA(Asn)/glutamyl-tRNA(Gln) amidotransferase subunit A